MESVEKIPTEATEVDTAKINLEIRKHLSFGIEYYKNKQYGDAIRNFKKVLEIDPVNELGYKYLADSYLRHPDTTYIDSAQTLYETATMQFPTNPYFFSGLGYIYQKIVSRLEGEIEDADSITKDKLSQQIDNFCYKALVNFQRAVSLDANDYTSINAIGLIFLRQSKLDSAMVWYEKSVIVDSNQAYIWDFLSKIYVAYNKNEDAMKAFGKLVQLLPEEPDYLLKFGQYCAKCGKFHRSLSILDEYIITNPDDYRGYQYLGLVKAVNKEFKEALTQFKKAEELNANSVKLLCDIANTYKDMKRYNSARNYISKAKKIDPNFGYIYIVEGDIIYSQAMDKIPESGEVNMEVKCTFLKASKVYRRVINNPDWGGLARSKLDFIKPYLPSREEIKQYRFMGGTACD
jgi:tetratricopeptide (TPR) repeat protein